MRSRSASLREIANKNADLARQSTNKNLQSVKFIKTAQTLPRTPIQYSKTRQDLLLRQVALGRLETAVPRHEDCEQPLCDAGQISFFSPQDNVLRHLASDRCEINYARQLLVLLI